MSIILSRRKFNFCSWTRLQKHCYLKDESAMADRKEKNETILGSKLCKSKCGSASALCWSIKLVMMTNKVIQNVRVANSFTFMSFDNTRRFETGDLQ